MADASALQRSKVERQSERAGRKKNQGIKVAVQEKRKQLLDHREKMREV